MIIVGYKFSKQSSRSFTTHSVEGILLGFFLVNSFRSHYNKAQYTELGRTLLSFVMEGVSS